MRSRVFVAMVLALAVPSIVLGADPAVTAPVTEPVGTTTPAIAPPAPAVSEKPKPVERPKPAEKPKPVDKPRIAAENPQPPETAPARTVESPAPSAAPALDGHGTSTRADEAGAGYSFGCLGLAFAMLIIGIAGGFLGRHFLSRHKLGGMTVRIGTWRGIP